VQPPQAAHLFDHKLAITEAGHPPSGVTGAELEPAYYCAIFRLVAGASTDTFLELIQAGILVVPNGTGYGAISWVAARPPVGIEPN
jgi:hypothetical protein